MVVVADRAIDAGDGTPERVWLPWIARSNFASVTADALVPAGHRLVVVAPHPDDEVLAAGGLLARVAALGRPTRVVAVTDGTASHAGSTCWTPHALGREREGETCAALGLLGVQGDVLRLGFDDGGVAHAVDALARRLEQVLAPRDVVLTTWRLDGHPDHEATARACAHATARLGLALLEAPVWAWHWARPGDPRLPWPRARRLSLDGATLRLKQAAVQAYRTQLLPDASTGQPAVLRPSIVQRAARPFELLFA